MALSQKERNEIGSVVDQWIRRAGGWSDVSPAELNRRVRERFPDLADREHSNTTRAAVNAAVIAARDAATMQVNPEFILPNLARTTWTTMDANRYVYRVVVVVEDGSGRDLQSSAVTVTSSVPLSGSNVHQIAIEQARMNWGLMTDKYVEFGRPGGQVVYKSFIVSAGVTR